MTRTLRFSGAIPANLPPFNEDLSLIGFEYPPAGGIGYDPDTLARLLAATEMR